MTRTRSVLHLVKGLGPGGAERLLVNQIRAEAEVDHHVAYVVAEKDHLVAELESLGATVTFAGGRGPRWVWRVRQVLQEHPTDIVHVHSPAVAAVTRLLVRTLPRAVRPVVVGTEHNRWPRHHRLTRLANRATVRFETATIAVSDDVAATIQGARPGQVRTIVHGIDLATVRGQADRSAVRHELGVGDDDLVVMCVANLRREKALDDLVEAARRALERAPHLRFFLIGQGPLAAEVDGWIAAAGVGDRFTAVGYRTDVPRLLSGADGFTLSSRHEGLPVAIMEALALGLPVIATAAGGIPDAVGAAGWIVPVGDRDALAAAYVRFAEDPAARADRATAAWGRSERFSVDRAVEEIAAVYDAATSTGDDAKTVS